MSKKSIIHKKGEMEEIILEDKLSQFISLTHSTMKRRTSNSKKNYKLIKELLKKIKQV